MREWRMELSEDGTMYRTISGAMMGKMVIGGWTAVTTKNDGRSNARSINEQAISEIEAAYKKKLKEHYVTNPDDYVEHFTVMLAEDYHKHIKKLGNTPRFVQPKLDGFRCYIRKDGMFSRTDESITSCPHIMAKVKPFFDLYPDGILDGELYNHTLHDDFDKLQSLITKRYRTVEEDEEIARVVEYHLYDVLTTEDDNNTYGERYNLLCDVVTNIVNDEMVKVVDCEKTDNHERVQQLHEHFTSKYYEGSIIRLDTPYQKKRTNMLLKYKDFHDEEYELLDILEGNGNWLGMAKVACLRMPDGKTFEANIAAPMKVAKWLLVNKDRYLGKMTTVRYPNLTPDGKPRFGQVKEFGRLDV